MAAHLRFSYTCPFWLCGVHSPRSLFSHLDMLTYCSTFATSVYSPALQGVMQHFHVSRTVGLLPLTFYTLGLGFGPVLAAPLSERHGRRPVYLITAAIFMLFTLGAGFSQSIASFCVCRWFAGLAGSPVLAVGAGSIADLWLRERRATTTSLWALSPFAGTALGCVCCFHPCY